MKTKATAFTIGLPHLQKGSPTIVKFRNRKKKIEKKKKHRKPTNVIGVEPKPWPTNDFEKEKNSPLSKRWVVI